MAGRESILINLKKFMHQTHGKYITFRFKNYRNKLAFTFLERATIIKKIRHRVTRWNHDVGQGFCKQYEGMTFLPWHFFVWFDLCWTSVCHFVVTNTEKKNYGKSKIKEVFKNILFWACSGWKSWLTKIQNQKDVILYNSSIIKIIFYITLPNMLFYIAR